MNMKVSHVANMISGFHCLPVAEKRARLAKIHRSGGMEALETAALLVGWDIHRTRCMAGVEAKRVGRRRYSRTGREKPAMEEFRREAEAIAQAACGGRGEYREARRDNTASRYSEINPAHTRRRQGGPYDPAAPSEKNSVMVYVGRNGERWYTRGSEDAPQTRRKR